MSDYQFNPDIEQWKAIPDFPGYEVSDHGRVRSYWKVGQRCWHLTNIPQKFKSPSSNGRGYLTVSLYRDKKEFRKYIHSLVLLIFLGPCPPGYQGCHNDGDKSKNHFSNLRYDTHKNNENDKIKHGTLTLGERNGCAKLSKDQVVEIRKMYQQGFTHLQIAQKYNVGRENIGMIIRRKTWDHIP